MTAPVAVAVRRMTAADLDPVLALAQNLHSAPHWQRQAYLNALDPLAMPRRIALVAAELQSGAVMGFAVASLLPPEAELETMAVAPARQRQGIGRILFAALAADLKAAGATDLLLEVRASNQAALGFYRVQGFVQAGLRHGYYAEPKEDAVLMRLGLA